MQNAHTSKVRIASSITADLLKRATRAASSLGISRSALVVRAVHRYLRDLNANSLVAQIDETLASGGVEDDSSAAAVALGHRRMMKDAESW